MAEVKWIKITTDMFDNRKIKHLRRLPDGNNIVLIWVMLLTMAGRCNASGMIFLTENIPYTPKMLADELDFEENTVLLALEALERYNMIVSDNGVFTIAGWEEYQNIEGMERIREQNRIRQQRKRDREKQALIGTTQVCEYCGKEGNTVDHLIPLSKGGLDIPSNTVCSCLSCNMTKTNRELSAFLNELMMYSVDFELCRILENKKIMNLVNFEDETSRFVSRYITQQKKKEDIEIEEEREREKINYQQIADLFNSLCPSFPSIKTLSDARKKAIKARLNTYTIDDFKTLFEKAEASAFLKGANDRNWTASFDWLIKDANMAKVLDGNYDNRPAQKKGRKEIVPSWMQGSGRNYDFDELEQELTENSPKTIGNDPDLTARAEQLKRRIGGN